MKTIVALSTPNFKSAIHIIRVSGDKAFECLQKICRPRIEKKGYTIQKVDIYNGKQKIDEVLLNKFVCPKSYTGEDLIEINCHGSLYVVNKIIDSLIKSGCSLAKRGEFTKRAFLNGKISLIQSEAINNLINSSSDLAIDVALNGLSDKTNKVLKKTRDEIFKILGQVEVSIDYPEYDSTPDVSKEQINKIFNDSIKTFQRIISDSSNVLNIKDGIKVAIVGKPNVGKSSLLNALLKEDKAIVTNIPGTTRDAIESSCIINGIKYIFVDTAGIRNTKSKIESIGIKKSKDSINKADLVILVLDNSKLLDKQDKQLLKLVSKKQNITVLNKTDVANKNKINGIKISAKKKQINELIEYLSSYKNINTLDLTSKILLQSQESVALLSKALNHLMNAKQIYDKNINTELLTTDLKECIDILVTILGLSNDLSFVDELFNKFCVGK